ncbi:hypothetical protein HY522_03665 [bacterium]|nr:hypothetical protein [bacterium]
MAAGIPREDDTKLITCILPKGSGRLLLESLHNYGVTTANLYFARGSDAGDPVDEGGLALQVQKEIVTVVVSKKDAGTMFDFVIEHANLSRPGGGMAYMGGLTQSVPFVLPELPDTTRGETELPPVESTLATDKDTRLITCILPRGSGKPLLEAIHQRGATSGNLYFARGSNIGDPLGKSGIPPQVEKEIVTVLVGKKEAGEMFDFVIDAGQISRDGGGFVYMGELRKSVPFVLPDMPPEPKPS